MWAEPRPPQYLREEGWITAAAAVAASPEPSAWTEALSNLGPPGRICGAFRASPVAAGT